MARKQLTFEDIRKMPPEQRRRTRLRGQKRGAYRSNTVKMSRAELIAWAKEKGIKTTGDLKRLRGDGDPTLYDFRKEFVRWSVFVEEAYGEIKKKGVTPEDVLGEIPYRDIEYVIKLINEKGIKTRDQYLSFRRLYPEQFPSIYRLKQHFNCWADVLFTADKYTMTGQMKHYYRLMNKYGRCPTREECKKEDCPIDLLIAHFDGSKRKVDEYMKALWEMDRAK